MDSELLFGIVVLIAFIFLVIGLIKRTFGMCMIALILAVFLGVTQPEVVEEIASSIVSMFDGAIDPMRDEDYVDMVGNNGTLPNQGFGDIGKDPD